MKRDLMIKESNPKILRVPHLAENVVFIDGLEGCGKTLFSSLISSFDRVEKLNYSYEIENICSLDYLNKFDKSVSVSLIRMWTDLILYNSMMSRDVNFRPSDISSAFKYHDKLEYLKRLFYKGDEDVPSLVKKKNPILALTVHKLISRSQSIFKALDNRLKFIEIVRHPLYMITQQSLNNENMMDSVRDFTLYFEFNGRQLPWYTFGWEKEFLSLNSFEQSILYIKKMNDLTNNTKKKLGKNCKLILTIPFEIFVKDPNNYMDDIAQHINSSITNKTLKELKRQKVPRKKYSDGLPLEIYKRCGWEKPEKDLSELEEFQKRRDFVELKASKKYMNILDKLCSDYELKYFKKKLNINGKYS